MLRYTSFGPSSFSLSLVSARVGLVRGLSLALALRRRGYRVLPCVDFDGVGRCWRGLEFWYPASEGCRAWLVFSLPRPVEWVVGLRGRYLSSRFDPFFPASRRRALLDALFGVRV